MRLARTFLLSIGLHLTALWCLSLISPVPPTESDSRIDGYVEFVDDPKPREENRKYIVRKHQVPKEFLSEDAQVDRRFMSEDRQTVLEETRAAESGLTKNRSYTLPSTQNDGSLSPDEAGKNKRGSATLAQDGLAGEIASGNDGADDQGNVVKFPNMRRFGLEAGRSTFGDAADASLKIGEMTALNTDRFLYYSFYERAQDLVYHHWEKYVRAVLYTYQNTGAATGDEYWITRVEIVLDKNGKFLKGMIHQGSGLQGLDLAPVHAFRDAQMIPHPPVEMVQADGTVRMDWEFEVKVQSRIAVSN